MIHLSCNRKPLCGATDGAPTTMRGNRCTCSHCQVIEQTTGKFSIYKKTLLPPNYRDSDPEPMVIVHDEGQEREIGRVVFDPSRPPFSVPFGVSEGAKHAAYGESEWR